MKYALIAMVVIYLITFGCSPDEEKKAADSHKEATHTAVEAAPQNETAPAVAEHKEEAVHAAAEQQGESDGDHQAPVAEEQAPAAEAAQDQHAAASKPEEESAGDAAVKAEEPTAEQPAAEEKAEEPAEVAAADEPAAAVAEEEVVTMPCGQVIARKDIPAGAPCLNYTAQGAVPTSEELNAAMLRMVEATNNMVKVTQQMVIATQEMLNVSKAASADAAAQESGKK
jgi:hypothetical protein